MLSEMVTRRKRSLPQEQQIYFSSFLASLWAWLPAPRAVQICRWLPDFNQACWVVNTKTLDCKSGASWMILGRMIWRTVCSPWKRRSRSPKGVRKWENEVCSHCHLVKTFWQRGGRTGMSLSPSWVTWSDVVHILSCCLISQRRWRMTLESRSNSGSRLGPKGRAHTKKRLRWLGRLPKTASSIAFCHLNKRSTESVDQAPVWLKRDKTKERTSFLLMHWLWEAVFILRSRASTLRSTLASTGVRRAAVRL